MSRVTSFDSWNGQPKNDIIALMVFFNLYSPNVIIWLTFLYPYLPSKYLIASARRLRGISVSISGNSKRPGFKKRSKKKPFLIGSTLVIFNTYEIILPAAEPLPGPHKISLLLHHSNQSHNIKK